MGVNHPILSLYKGPLKKLRNKLSWLNRGQPVILHLPKAVGYESSIFFNTDSIHGIVVTKKYKLDVECIKWLNKHLSKYYDPFKGQPVAQHEFAALKLLEPYGFVPKPLNMLADSIQMEYVGTPLSVDSEISKKDYLRQCEFILDIFKKINFKHNDLLSRNVLCYKGKIRIIDFTLSEFNNIDIISDLPEPTWAIPGKDGNIFKYLSEVKSV